MFQFRLRVFYRNLGVFVLFNYFQLLKNHKNFRLLFVGHGLSFIGNQMTMVALAYQVYHLTQSVFYVGLLNFFQFIPLLVTALVGGLWADQFNRKRILFLTELILSFGALSLFINAKLTNPSVIVVFLTAVMMTACGGLQRPSAQSLLQTMFSQSEMSQVSILWSNLISFAMVIGPSIAGIIIAQCGVHWVYAFDVSSFIISLILLSQLKLREQRPSRRENNLALIGEGFKFAFGRQVLLGSYLVDFVAMIFGMPSALFPALAHKLGGPQVLGFFYTALSVGALVATFFSGWTQKIKHYGQAITLSAAVWGIFIILLGFSSHFLTALFYLAVAGGADAISGIFRQTLWNKVIPNEKRGRLAGIEMISYMSGPMLGNLEAGIVASIVGIPASIISGGVICVIGVGLLAWKLPDFWKYKAEE